MMTITPLISEFVAIGELQDINLKSDGRVKYLLLSTEEGEYSIKVQKDQPKNLSKQLKPGTKLKVKGMLKQKVKKETSEYKAFSIELLSVPTVKQNPQVQISTVKSGNSKKKKAKILICKKSNCWNKGGQEVYRQIKSELASKGVAEEIGIKTTGCLKRCKKAPNIVVLPDKKQYVRVKPKQISSILEKHLV